VVVVTDCFVKLAVVATAAEVAVNLITSLRKLSLLT